MTRSTKLIIGAGPTGTHTALLLAEAGHDVRVVSRRGGASLDPRIVHVALDASDAESLATLAEGASTIFNARCRATIVGQRNFRPSLPPR
jgi:2-polyprenyl-6-methoxyphenol hydroxylase-like FAD-dependent oxidoreductase